MRGLYCACSQAPGQQGHLVPKQTLPSLELLALHVCVSMCACVCLCVCLHVEEGEQYLSVRMHHQNEGREHLSNISAFHITTHSAQPVCDGGFKGRHRNSQGGFTGQAAFTEHFGPKKPQQCLLCIYCRDSTESKQQFLFPLVDWSFCLVKCSSAAFSS